MTIKHTPGPWQINNFDPFQVCDADGEARGCAAIAVMHGTAKEKRANARLIAAAPELLAALECLLGDIEQDMLTDRGAHRMVKSGKRVEQARAAIAKATA